MVRPLAARSLPPLPADLSQALPESLSYRIKNKLLGPPLVNEKLSGERLTKKVALGVLSSDCISSSAYGSEAMLTQLLPFVGLAAFTLLIPVTIAILVILVLVTLSYREVVMVYTKAGGSYVVARDNLGPNVAQVAAVALLIDYTVTVAVQTAAGTDAVVSAFPALASLTLPISIVVIVLLCWGNLRGIREAGRTFALPTYFFISSLGLVIVVGFIREILGTLHAHSIHLAGAVSAGHPGRGLLMGASVYVVLKSFANGGSSLTGLEAISNGVGAFEKPEGRNARRTLVVMSMTLGFLVLGVSLLAHWTHAVPFSIGSPTVISQEVKYVLGTGVIGNVLFYVIQAATMLILYTGANTSFNGFPFLASFVAGDAFLPRQLTKRGHRLAFSNGIITLAIVGIVLLVVTRAKVDSLLGVYAIGVFTGFTMAGAGMVKHHLEYREDHWRRRLVINASAAGLSASVVVILAWTKFFEGAWVVVVLFPLLLWALIRLHHQYQFEATELEDQAGQAATEPVLRRHVVLVLVDRLDLATARAIQYGRTLNPDELRAVHFMIDSRAARHLEQGWGRLGLSQLPLDIIDCPDRRLGRASLELVAETVAGGQTEVTVILPWRAYSRSWSRLLHDRTAERIAEVVGELPHANATIVPFHLERAMRGGRLSLSRRRDRQGGPDGAGRGSETDGAEPHQAVRPKGRGEGAARPRRGERAGKKRDVLANQPSPAQGAVPVAEVQPRQRARVAGRVRAVRVPTSTVSPSLECTLDDSTGRLTLVFLGRRKIAGVEIGTCLAAEGTVQEHRGRLTMINPDLVLLVRPDQAAVEAAGYEDGDQSC